MESTWEGQEMAVCIPPLGTEASLAQNFLEHRWPSVSGWECGLWPSGLGYRAELRHWPPAEPVPSLASAKLLPGSSISR